MRDGTGALRGSFAVFPPELVLGLLGEARATGELRAGGVALEVTDGQPTAASHRAVSGDAAIAALADLGAASFAFAAGPTGAANLAIGMDELRERVRRERDSMVEIRTVIPNDRCHFAISAHADSSEGFRVTPVQLRLLRAIEGRRRDVTRVASAAEVDRNTALADLAGLIREGIVDVLQPESKPRRARAGAAPKVARPKTGEVALQEDPPTPYAAPNAAPNAAPDAAPEPRRERPEILIGANEIAAQATAPAARPEPAAADKTSFFVSHYMPSDVTVLGVATPAATPKPKDKPLFGLFEIFAPKPKPSAAAPEDPPSSPRHLAALANALLFGFIGADEERREGELRELIAKAPAMEPPFVVADGKLRFDEHDAALYQPARAVPHLQAIIRELFEGADRVHGGDYARRVLQAAVDQVWGAKTELRRDAERIVGFGPTLRARLVIEKGGSSGPFTLGDAPCAIGRSSTNDIVLHDTSVSRKHARFTPRGGRFVLTDEGSSAGTRVNGQPVSGERPLKNGDKIALGDVLLRFEQS